MSPNDSSTAPTLLLEPDYLLPVAPENILLTDHSVLMVGQTIAAVGPRETLRQQFPQAMRQALPGEVILPGLVNAHGHAAMSLFRGLADDLALMTWLNDHIWPAEGRHVSQHFCAVGARLAIAEMLATGTTCFADMYFFPEASAAEATAAGIRTSLSFPILDFPSNWGSGPDQYLSLGLDLHDRYRHSDLVSVGFGPHAPYTVSDPVLEKVATLAHQLDLPIQIHVHETAAEIEAALQTDKRRPLRRLYDIGLLTPATQCVHMTQVNDEDLALLVETQAAVVHCPQSNLKLASGFCPVQKLLDAGIRVGLGTDGAASNNDLDLFDELKTAALLAKAVAGDARALPALQALHMATLGGAAVLGLEQRIGSIEVGKQADLVALNLDDLASQPIYHVPSQLVYTSGGSRVTHTWVAGRLCYRHGHWPWLDSERLQAEVRQLKSRVGAVDPVPAGADERIN